MGNLVGAMPRRESSIAAVLISLALTGCQEVVISEKPKNDLFGRLSGSPSQRGRPVPGGTSDIDPTLLPPIRQVLPDGTIILRARTARDLMSHIRRAVTDPNQGLERELFVEQILSDKTRGEYEDRGLDPSQAFDTLRARRDDILLLFNRIGPLAENSPQVILQKVGDNIIRLQVTGMAREGLAWTFMDMSNEGGNWRLRWFG